MVHSAISLRVVLGLAGVASAAGALVAQELEPGAYSPAPIGFNILVVADTFSSGDIAFDPSGPIDNGSADINTTVAGYVRTFGLAGRAASLGVAVPYVRGDVDGDVFDEARSVHRSGWGDPRVRFAVNFHGVPAMSPKEFAGYKPDTIVGGSLTVGVPLGQYMSDKLVNIGGNRWACKPEIGASKTLGSWTLEAALGAWFFADNDEFFGGSTREQDPIGSLQTHLIYTFRPRLWLAFDANYYTGGRNTVDGVRKLDLQKNSRIGLTLAVPLNRQHSIKASFSRGATTTVGADFDAVGLSYQYIWGGGR